MSQTQNKKIKFSQPGNYYIQVLGIVPTVIWDYYEGKTDHLSTDESGNVTTTLKMYVRDQAELSGLINALYNWRLVLLSIKVE